MRALVVCDKVEPILYSAGIQQHVGKVDLVISCGDLPHYYIEFIMSMLGRPTYYVHGNHARTVEYHAGSGNQWRQMSEPLGAVNLHMQTVKEGDLLLAGLEGCREYKPDAPFQYRESSVRWQTQVLDEISELTGKGAELVKPPAASQKMTASASA